jgi:hypothetical protein
MNEARIAVFPGDEAARIRALAEAFHTCLPVSVEAWRDTGREPPDALILLGFDAGVATAAARQGIRCLVLPRRADAVTFPALAFSQHHSLPACLRGQSLAVACEAAVREIDVQPDDEVLASWENIPLWVRRKWGGATLDMVRVCLPNALAGSCLGLQFRSGGFLPYTPLLIFLRDVAGPRAWVAPASRACFVFDDPNLFRMSYGFVDFRALSAHAERHGYHASIATIPLDMRRAHEDVAAVFRENPNHLSLLIHGNDHTWRELMRLPSGRSGAAILSQALWRAGSLEKRLRVRVAPIMESPHGAFSRSLAPTMSAQGFDAALVTLDLLAMTDAPGNLPVTAGLHVAEPLPGGLCGLPRIRMTAFWPTDAILAVLLGQPVVIAGHHDDARDGLDFLAEMVVKLRGIGITEWRDPARLAQAAYLTRREEDTLHVRVFGRRSRVPLPAGIRELRVAHVWPPAESREAPQIRLMSDPALETAPASGVPVAGDAASVHGETLAEIVYPAHPAMDNVPRRRTGVWPSMRRMLTEARDRSRATAPWLMFPSRRRERSG